LVDDDKYVELFCRQRKQFPVFDGRSSHLAGSLDFMAGDIA